MSDTPRSGRQGSATWNVSAHEGRVRMRLSGEIDLAAVEGLRTALLKALDEALQPGVLVECDLAGVAYMDSTGFHMLVKVQDAIEEGGGRLVLVRPSFQVRQILDIAGGDLFRIIE
jgi:anti-sigma B factor antagonist